MERSGFRPTGALRPDDLVGIAERPGPLATVVVGLTGQGSYGRDADRARRKDILHRLEAEGAPAGVCTAVDGALASVDSASEGAVVVADDSRAVLVERLDDRPKVDVVRWAPIASVSAVIEQRQCDIPVIVVLADRLGADIVVRSHDVVERLQLDGEEYPIHKSGQGGWSQPRWEQRVENTWERNARSVVEQIEPLITAIDPVLVILGGDERAVELVHSELPAPVRPLVRTIKGGRATDGSQEQREEDIRRLVRTAIAQQTVDLVDDFENQSGSARRAVNGARATLEALRGAQVDVLLVHDDPDDERTAWFGVGNGEVALHREDLESTGAGGDLTEGRLVDVAIHAALLTGAAVRVVPQVEALDGGIGAILRWSD